MADKGTILFDKEKFKKLPLEEQDRVRWAIWNGLTSSDDFYKKYTPEQRAKLGREIVGKSQGLHAPDVDPVSAAVGGGVTGIASRVGKPLASKLLQGAIGAGSGSAGEYLTGAGLAKAGYNVEENPLISLLASLATGMASAKGEMKLAETLMPSLRPKVPVKSPIPEDIVPPTKEVPAVGYTKEIPQIEAKGTQVYTPETGMKTVGYPEEIPSRRMKPDDELTAEKLSQKVADAIEGVSPTPPAKILPKVIVPEDVNKPKGVTFSTEKGVQEVGYPPRDINIGLTEQQARKEKLFPEQAFADKVDEVLPINVGAVGKEVGSISNIPVEHLAFMKSRMQTGEGPGIVRLGDSVTEPGAEKRMNIASSFPEWFSNRGYSSKEIISTIDKAMRGEPLTQLQQAKIRELYGAAEKEIKKAFGLRMSPKMDVDPASLKMGDSILDDGITWRYVGQDEEGNIILKSQQGGERKYGAFDWIRADEINPVSKEISQADIDKTVMGAMGKTKLEGPLPIKGTPEYQDMLAERLYQRNKFAFDDVDRAELNKTNPVDDILEKKLGSKFPDVPPGEKEITLMNMGVPVPEWVKKGATNIASKTLGALYEFAGSPSQIMGKHPVSKRIWEMLYRADKEKEKFLYQMSKGFNDNVKIRLGSDSAERLGMILDKYDNLDSVPRNVLDNLTNEEKQAFVWMRQQWNNMADILQERGLLPESRRLKSYFFRIFDDEGKEQIVNGWLRDKERIELLVESGQATGADRRKLATIINNLGEYNRTGNILWNYVPSDYTAPFLKERRGAEGYMWDAVGAFQTYMRYFAKQIYDTPAVKESAKMLGRISDRNLKTYTEWFIKDFFGLNRMGRFDDVARAITGFEYLSKLGWNIQSALVNSTQVLNTIVDIGPQWTSRGARLALTERGKELWEASGHAFDVPGMFYGQIYKHSMDKLFKNAFYLFQKVENANRKIAYLGAIEKSLNEGKTLAQAMEYGDEIVRRTQFLYGRMDMPRAMRHPIGKVAFQFMSYPIKQIEFLKNLGPKKLAAYLLLAEGTKEGLKQGLGVDISNALGIGVDFKELFRGLYDLSRGDTQQAKVNIGLSIRPGAGVLPSGVTPIYSDIKNLMAEKYDRLMPTQIRKFAETAQALKEGQVVTPEGKGYPIRQYDKDLPLEKRTLKETYTPAQLATRTVVRTSKDTEAYKRYERETAEEKNIKGNKEKILKYLVSGRIDKARELSQRTGIVISDKAIESLLMKSKLTNDQRRQLRMLQRTSELPARMRLRD